MPSRRSDPLDLGRTLRFLRGLKRNNDRTWFHAHRADWDGHIRHAWEDLVTMLLLAGSKFDSRLTHVDPKSCLFRLANDTRFRNEKTPYKAHLSAWMSPGGKNGAFAGYYCHVEPGRAHFSAGIYVPTKPVLRSLRETFAADGTDARRFDRILGSKGLRAYLPLETEPLRVTPPGFDKHHPRIALIRARNYLVSHDFSERELTARGAFALFQGAMRDVAPFVRWIDERAAAATPTLREPDDEELWGR